MPTERRIRMVQPIILLLRRESTLQIRRLTGTVHTTDTPSTQWRPSDRNSGARCSSRFPHSCGHR
jgi:hypothetical protein